MPFFKPLNQSAAFGFPGFASQPGTVTYTPGTYSFTIPPYRNMVIELWGAGGAGGSTGSGYAQSGGSTVITLPNGVVLTAGGGQGGESVYSNRWHRGHYDGQGGAGGVASGGDVNISGSAGASGARARPGRGGNGANGGAGGAGGNNVGAGLGKPGGFPGGGGGGWDYGLGGGKFSWDTGGGGGGSYCKKMLKIGKIRPHTTMTVVVGAGGNPTSEGGHGGNGQVTITWT